MRAIVAQTGREAIRRRASTAPGLVPTDVRVVESPPNTNSNGSEQETRAEMSTLINLSSTEVS